MQLKVSLLDRYIRIRQRWVSKFQDYETWCAASPQEKREFIMDVATTIPGKVSRSAEFLVNSIAQSLPVYNAFLTIVKGGYETRVVTGSKEKKIIAPPLSGLHQLSHLLGLRQERMMVFVDAVISGQASLAYACQKAKRLKCLLRLRTYVLERFIELNGGQFWNEVEEITYKWLQERNLVTENFEGQYSSYFKGNKPEEKVVDEINNQIRSIWNRFLDTGRPVEISSDDQYGCKWLRKNYPGEAQGNSARFFNGPRSKILVLNCKTEDLASYIVKLNFRKYLFFCSCGVHFCCFARFCCLLVKF